MVIDRLIVSWSGSVRFGSVRLTEGRTWCVVLCLTACKVSLVFTFWIGADDDDDDDDGRRADDRGRGW